MVVINTGIGIDAHESHRKATTAWGASAIIAGHCLLSFQIRNASQEAEAGEPL